MMGQITMNTAEGIYIDRESLSLRSIIGASGVAMLHSAVSITVCGDKREGTRLAEGGALHYKSNRIVQFRATVFTMV